MSECCNIVLPEPRDPKYSLISQRLCVGCHRGHTEDSMYDLKAGVTLWNFPCFIYKNQVLD